LLEEAWLLKMKEQLELLVLVGLALVPLGAAVKRAWAAMMVLLGSLQLRLQIQGRWRPGHDDGVVGSAASPGRWHWPWLKQVGDRRWKFHVSWHGIADWLGHDIQQQRISCIVRESHL
jgi:hypothetical protein